MRIELKPNVYNKSCRVTCYTRILDILLKITVKMYIFLTKIRAYLLFIYIFFYMSFLMNAMFSVYAIQRDIT